MIVHLLMVATSVQQTAEVRVQMKPVAVQSAVAAREKRAIITLHGFRAGANGSEVDAPTFESWQEDGRLLQQLVPHADVFSLAYGQGQSIADIARSPTLLTSLRQICAQGYREITLVGHSAGGTLLRHILEDNPDVRVSRLVQVCSPNGGCPGADRFPVDPRHRAFIRSLTPAALKARGDKVFPRHTEWLCVISEVVRGGDCVIPGRMQWPKDLQDMGVPAIRIHEPHFSIMTSRTATTKLAELILR